MEFMDKETLIEIQFRQISNLSKQRDNLLKENLKYKFAFDLICKDKLLESLIDDELKYKCNCVSYNMDSPDKHGDKEVILKAPSWSSRGTICIDYCIADIIKMLWENGVVTHGCCCGHNKQNPTVIVSPENLALTISLLNHDIDGRGLRKWNIGFVDSEFNGKEEHEIIWVKNIDK